MSANATEVAAYRDLYYKEVDERDNPIMWLDLSSTMGTIEYKRGYPYIEWQQRVLQGEEVMVFDPQNMTLIEAQKKAIVEDEYLGFSIKILLEESYTEDVSGEVIFYKENTLTTNKIYSSGAPTSSTHKIQLYMKMRKDRMPESIEYLKETQNYIQALGSVEAISILSDDDQEPVSATALLDGMKILIPLEGLIDIEDEKQRLQKNLAKIDKDIKSSKQRLLNKDFRSKAPQEIIDQLKTRLEHLIRDKTKIEDQFNRLSKG